MACVLRPPELQSIGNRVNVSLTPPLRFVPRPMQFGVMFDTERHGPLVTDLAAQGARLGKACMVGLTGALPADDAGKGGNITPVVLVPLPNGRADGQDSLINGPCTCTFLGLGSDEVLALFGGVFRINNFWSQCR